MKQLEGYKNYIWGLLLILNGAAGAVDPGMSPLSSLDPTASIGLGISWILGRNALKKVER